MDDVNIGVVSLDILDLLILKVLAHETELEYQEMTILSLEDYISPLLAGLKLNKGEIINLQARDSADLSWVDPIINPLLSLFGRDYESIWSVEALKHLANILAKRYYKLQAMIPFFNKEEYFALKIYSPIKEANLSKAKDELYLIINSNFPALYL